MMMIKRRRAQILDWRKFNNGGERACCLLGGWFMAKREQTSQTLPAGPSRGAKNVQHIELSISSFVRAKTIINVTIRNLLLSWKGRPFLISKKGGLMGLQARNSCFLPRWPSSANDWQSLSDFNRAAFAGWKWIGKDGMLYLQLTIWRWWDNLTPRTIWHLGQFDTNHARRTIWHLGQFDT